VELTIGEITAWVGSLMWPLMRVGAMVMVAPVFGNDLMPVRIRVFFGLALTVAILPAVGEVPAVDPLSAEGVMISVQQVLIGLIMGFMLLMAVNVVVVAGESMALAMGLGFATMVDPQTGMSVPVLSQVMLVIVTLVFLGMGGHLMLIELTAESFAAMPIAAEGVGREAFFEVASWAAQMFAGAVLIALPVVTVLLIINLALGVMTRAAPQMNVFSVGLPITMLVGPVLVLGLVLPVLPTRMAMMWSNAFAVVRDILTITT